MKTYNNFEDFLNSHSLEDLERFSESENNNDEEIFPYLAENIKAIYINEMAIDQFPDDNELLIKLFPEFLISISIFCNIKVGHIEIKSGKLTLINNNATFALTKKGIDSVEKMIKK